MGYRTVTGFSREVKKTLSPEALDALGREAGLCERLREIAPRRLATSLLASFACGRVETLADLLAWLRREDYRHLVVSREPKRRFDTSQAVTIRAKSGGEVRLVREKERGIAERFARRFETALDALSAGLSRPRTRKEIGYVRERIGRLKEKEPRRGAPVRRRGRR